MSSIQITENEPAGNRKRISMRYTGDAGEIWNWRHIYVIESEDLNAFAEARRIATDAAIIQQAADALVDSRVDILTNRFERVMGMAREGTMAPDQVFIDLKNDAQRLADWVSP